MDERQQDRKHGRKRRRTGASAPIDYTSFPDDTLVLYLRNLEFHVRKGGIGQMQDQYEKAFTEARSRGLKVADVRPRKV